MSGLFFFLKHAAGAIAALVATYSLLWSLGLAFVTNNQAQRMIDAGIAEDRKTRIEFQRHKYAEIDSRIDKVVGDFRGIEDIVTRLDERTKSIDDNVKILRQQR